MTKSISDLHGIDISSWQAGTGGNGIMGSLYIRQDSTTTYTFLGSSFSALYIATVYGIK